MTHIANWVGTGGKVPNLIITYVLMELAIKLQSTGVEKLKKISTHTTGQMAQTR